MKEPVLSFYFSGHGGFGMNLALINQLVCFMQVSPTYCTIKSDDRFLLLLPCPHQCPAIAYNCLSALKLFLCGDIELNPGPTTQQMFKKILEGQNELRKDVTDLLEKTENLIADVGKRFLEIENHTSELKLKTAKLDDLDKIIYTQKTIEFQTRKLTNLGDRSRRSNVVVFGIADDTAESEADLRRKVITDTFERKLNVKCESAARIYRLGKATTNAPNRPVILFFKTSTKRSP